MAPKIKFSLVKFRKTEGTLQNFLKVDKTYLNIENSQFLWGPTNPERFPIMNLSPLEIYQKLRENCRRFRSNLKRVENFFQILQKKDCNDLVN